ncbi:hypothetical protein AWM63_09760 [Riemerella anatipestifer]|uniref:hypothetical protein n=1 Tax=Riemerella anatipestifer TaxID=34085 RepID=UPI0007ED423F|nr:hypothetical protein [Riemerella anatipestifer]OBP53860.1 hypothetical protein AWM63_09760 [Riemerella anatipestifer]
MNKIILLGLLAFFTANAQIQVQNQSANTIGGENPFMDASYFNQFSNTLGKGLYFPTTNLTTWEFKLSSIDPGKFSNYFDGMVVYNSGTGLTVSNTGKGGKQVSVSPGFYYFKNPNQTFPTGSVANGEWVRLSSDGGVSTNLYTVDGTLAGNRTVTLEANNLVFKGAGNIGIGTDAPTTKLDVAGGVRIADGTQGENKVLVSDATGKASWKIINQVQNISVTSTIDPNVLGYFPDPTKTVYTAASSVTYNGKTATKGPHLLNYIDPYGNYHSYTTYISPNNITWYEAYNMAKNLGGYLATFTSDEEWKIVEMGLLNNNTTFNTVGAWIGMVKYSWYAGSALQPNPEMKWITGEQPFHDYASGGTSAVRKSNWFNTGEVGGGVEPNNDAGNEGFVHTWPKDIGFTKTYNGYTSLHPWNDIPANPDNVIDRANVKAFIIEFIGRP